ncbi:MAG: 3-dehydroquinate synthase [Muribaculaceae bacterium]|nr:3-dehydroquinate synthase [Muribaculaceae bacterium]
MARKYLTNTPDLTIDQTIRDLDADKTIIITDSNVEKMVFPSLRKSEIISYSPRIIIEPGEEGKNLDTVIRIWEKLESSGCTRRSVALNIGGGVVTDIGGFAAATFKRGIRTVNFPTTLLGAVDAATGGKTGFNFHGLKNEIGAFHQPQSVILSVVPFYTLPQEELLSGYAELIKTALISDKELYESLLNLGIVLKNPDELGKYVEKSVDIKDEVVAQDPEEKGLRKILNFGHTAGHAFESIRFCSDKISHGAAVAHGMLVALLLSNKLLGLNWDVVKDYCQFLIKYYGQAVISETEIPEILEKMGRDKKNSGYGQPSFTLLREVGVPVTDCHPTFQEITESLKSYIKLTVH